MSLSQFQEHFSTLITQLDTPSIEQLQATPYLGEDLYLGKRVSICREKVRRKLNAQIKEVFTTVHAILGEIGFVDCCEAFLQSKAPLNPVDLGFASEFPDFLASFEQVESFPYLADVAMLDLGYYKSSFADESPSISNAFFSQLTPELLTVRKVQLHPACYWLSSDYAIYDIWQLYHAHLPPQNINHRKPQDVIIIRPEQKVELHEIDPGFVKVLDALDSGETLQQAFLEGNLIDKQFNAVGAVQFLVQNKLITSMY